MKKKISIYTRIGIILKYFLCIKDLSKFKKNIHKKLGKLIYHKKYNANDIVRLMCDMGMHRGSVVCIHCAMKEFYNYVDTANDLITGILDFIGAEGTLIMPAFPTDQLRNKSGYIFNKFEDKTGAGYLAETFRKYPGVKRSINIRHSVCAIGKYSGYLTEGHELCENCWDENSPWYKMCLKNALIFNLGMPRSYIGTFHHCVESLLRKKHPYFAQFFNLPCSSYYYNSDGKVCSYTSLECGIERRTRERRVTKYFDSEDWQIRKISNLEIKVFYSRSALDKMLKLAKEGITVYYVPSIKGYKF